MRLRRTVSAGRRVVPPGTAVPTPFRLGGVTPCRATPPLTRGSTAPGLILLHAAARLTTTRASCRTPPGTNSYTAQRTTGPRREGGQDTDDRAVRGHGRPPDPPRAPPARTHLPRLHRSSQARTAGRRPRLLATGRREQRSADRPLSRRAARLP